MTVYGVSYDSVGRQPIVLLRTSDGRRVLPIWIGSGEANAILTKLKGSDPPRPMTHDLLQSLVDLVGASVLRVAVTELRDNTYYAMITLRINGEDVELDSRPSDAIALAVRADAPDLRRRGRDRGVGRRGRAPAERAAGGGGLPALPRRALAGRLPARRVASARLSAPRPRRAGAPPRASCSASRLAHSSRSSASLERAGIRGHQRVEQALLPRRDRPSGSPGRACRRAARARARAAR